MMNSPSLEFKRKRETGVWMADLEGRDGDRWWICQKGRDGGWEFREREGERRTKECERIGAGG